MYDNYFYHSECIQFIKDYNILKKKKIMEPFVDTLWELVKVNWINLCELYRTSFKTLHHKINFFSFEYFKYFVFLVLSLDFFLMIVFAICFVICFVIYLFADKYCTKKTEKQEVKVDMRTSQDLAAEKYADYLLKIYQLKKNNQ